MIRLTSKGNFNKTEQFLKKASQFNIKSILEKYGQEGVDALSSATPIDTGLTASSWGYRLSITSYGYSITWYNTNVVNGVPIAIILQYGHGTKNGGYVQGIDYINPALRPIMDRIANEVWREVRGL